MELTVGADLGSSIQVDLCSAPLERHRGPAAGAAGLSRGTAVQLCF